MSEHHKSPGNSPQSTSGPHSSTKGVANQNHAPPQSDDGQDSVAAILDALTSEDEYLGAALVGRDGVPVVVHFKFNCNQEAAAAMGAAILGAADAALTDMIGEEVERFQVESMGHRYLGSCLDSELAFLLVTKTSVPAEDAFRRMQEAAVTLRDAIGGR